MQKRWVAGALFFVAFLLGFFWLVTLSMVNLIDYYRLGFAFETYEPSPTTPAALLPPFALAMVVYLANLLDVFTAQHRMASATREAAFTAQMEDQRPYM